jgi:hypothetical protein
MGVLALPQSADSTHQTTIDGIIILPVVRERKHARSQPVPIGHHEEQGVDRRVMTPLRLAVRMMILITL